MYVRLQYVCMSYVNIHVFCQILVVTPSCTDEKDLYDIRHRDQMYLYPFLWL